MVKSKPVTVLCTYRPKKGREKEFHALLRKHWPALHRAGLVSKEPPCLWRAIDKWSGRVFFVEIFQWKDLKASATAHQTPGVMAVWKPMDALLEKRELAMISPLRMPFAGP
jgi:hypothetical protein